MYGTMKDKKPAAKSAAFKKGGPAFKPCAACPSAGKCSAMGKCMAKAKAK